MGLYWKLLRFSLMNSNRRASWVRQEFDSAKREPNRELRKRRYRQLLDVRSELVGGSGNKLAPEINQIFDEIADAFHKDLHSSLPDN